MKIRWSYISQTVFLYVLFVIIPVAVTEVMFFMSKGNPQAISKLMVLLGVFTLAGLVFQVFSAAGLLKAIARMTEVVKQAKDGDLKVETVYVAYKEIQTLSTESNTLIKLFCELLSNVNSSTQEVKHLTSTVNSTSKDAADAAGQISESSESVSRGAIQQAGDAEECSRIAAELVDKVEEVSHSAELMTIKADAAKQMADFGKVNISELMEKSRLSELNMQDIHNRINELSNMAQNVSQITTTITGIASQTNLLSLNASIEAARAGEMGKGFAVVAGEIKKLADQSLDSSHEIAQIIRGIREQVILTTETISSTMNTISGQTESVNKTNEAFNSILNAVSELFDQLMDVKHGINKLADFKMVLTDSIANIAAVAQETAASTQEITSLMYSQANSAEILVQLSENLDKLMDNLEKTFSRFNFDRRTADKKEYAVIPCVDIQFFNETRNSAIQAGDKLGIGISWMAPKEFDSKEQAKLINEAVDKGIAGVCLGPVDGPEVRDAISKAAKKGVKFIFFDTDMPGCERASFIGTDNIQAGKMMGELVVKLLNGRGKVIGCAPNLAQQNFIQRLQGFKNAVSKFPDIKLIAMDAPDSSSLDARWKSLKQVIEKAGDFDCFVCLEAQGDYFSKKIKAELKLNPITLTFDKTEQSLTAVKEGYMTGIIAQRQGLWGELAVRRLNEALAGRKLKDFEDTGTYEINNHNLDIFIK